MMTSYIREPYRLFFPLAVLCGILGVGHWFLYGTGLIEHYSGFLHASIQMQACMGCFIAGFLMTAVPRMSASFPASRWEVAIQFILSAAVAAAYFLNRPAVGQAAYILWLLMLAQFLIRRFLGRDRQKAPLAHPPVEFLWVPAGILFAFTGAVCLLSGTRSSELIRFSQQIINQGFVLAVVTGVGSFLGPRITGRFRTARKEPVSVCTPETTAAPPRLKGPVLIQAAGILFFFLSFVLEGLNYGRAAYGLRALVVTLFFLHSGILPKWPKVRDLYAWILWLSFWFLALGLWGCVAHMAYRKESLHISFVGGLGLMTYAVATMVVLSHAGRAQDLKKPLPVLILLLTGVLASLGFRLAAVFSAEHFFTLLTVSSALWMLTGAAWLVFALRFIFVSPGAETAEAAHQEMKARVLKQ